MSTTLTNHRRLGSYLKTIKKDDYEHSGDVEIRLIIYEWKYADHFSFKVSNCLGLLVV